MNLPVSPNTSTSLSASGWLVRILILILLPNVLVGHGKCCIPSLGTVCSTMCPHVSGALGWKASITKSRAGPFSVGYVIEPRQHNVLNCDTVLVLCLIYVISVERGKGRITALGMYVSWRWDDVHRSSLRTTDWQRSGECELYKP